MKIPGTNVNLSKKRLLLGLFIGILLLPIPTSVVPEWSVRVEDQDGRPVVSTLVVQRWQHKTIEFSEHREEAVTDSDGLVHFQERFVYYPLAWRVPTGILRYASMMFAHGSVGIKAEVSAWDFPVNWAGWYGGGPLPERIVVKAS